MHVYHALRCCGRLCAVGEVDALVRMFRRAVFFRTETLPQRGAFATALALSIGATASSVRRGAPELRHGRILEYTGINPAEWSMLRHVGVFAGAGLDVGADDHAEDESDVSDAEEDSDWRDSDATTMASIYAQLEGTQLKSELETEEPASP